MHSLRLSLLALLAALAAATTISATSASYEHHRRQAEAHHRRSFDVTLGGPKRMAHRRATQVQLEAQAHLVRIAEAFADSNSQWQQAAIKQLSEGKTPQTYDEWYESQGGASASNNESKPKSHTKPTPKPQAKAAPKPKAKPSTPKPAASQQPKPEEPKSAPQETSDKPKETPKQAPKSSSSSSSSQSQSQSQQQSQQPKPSSGGSSSGGSSSGGSSSGGLLAGLTQIVSGDATYYSAGLGACGMTNSDDDYIVAAGQSLFDKYLTDGNPNHNPLCNKKVKLTYKGKSLVARITDRCPGCTAQSLDLTPKLFQDLIGDMGLGRVTITWGFVDALP